MTKYFIAGSNAMKRQLPNLNYDPKDVDVFYIEGKRKPKIESNLKIEYHTFPKHIFDLFLLSDNEYITLESLYVLKLSHAEYDIHWAKTVQHIQLIKKHLKTKYHSGSPIEFMSQRYKDLLIELKKHWQTVHTDKKKITLKMPKDKFFNKLVKREYDHDFLHQLMAYHDEPLYKKCLKDGQDVLLDENKFKALSYLNKLQLCREEIYVLALERYMIPNNFKLCEHEVYRKTVKRLVTQMTKGWFPTFVVDNYDKLYKMDLNYVNKFQKGLKDNVQRKCPTKK